MKHLSILLFTLILSALPGNVVFAQARFIDFDTYASPADNDLVNNFASSGFAQTIDSGITGGSVLVPKTNGHMAYKTLLNKYGNSQKTSLSIFFRYNLDSLAGDGKPIIIAFVPLDAGGIGDTSHSLQFYVGLNAGEPYIGMIQHGTGVSVGRDISGPNIVNNHWYKITYTWWLEQVSGFDYINADMVLSECGATGTDTPLPLAYTLGQILTTPTFVNAAHYSAEIHAAHRFGILRLDDLTLSGPQFVGIDAMGLLDAVTIYPTLFKERLMVSLPFINVSGTAKFTLTALDGRCIVNGPLKEGRNELEMPDIPSGIYVASVTNGNQVLRKRIVKY